MSDFISYPFESRITGTDSEGNKTYDRVIGVEDERIFNRMRFTTGVFTPPANGLKVTAHSGMHVQIEPGGAHIDGVMCHTDATWSVPLNKAHSTYPRIDRVVLAKDDSDGVRGVNIKILTGTPETHPRAKELTRESAYYEICLADIYVRAGVSEVSNSLITDRRMDEDVCGIVHPAFPVPLNLQSLYTQYQASLEEYMSIVQSALDGTTAGTIKGMIGTLGDLKTDDKSCITASINEVFRMFGQYLKKSDVDLASGNKNIDVYDIACHGLAAQQGITSMTIECQTVNGAPTAFKNTSTDSKSYVDFSKGIWVNGTVSTDSKGVYITLPLTRPVKATKAKIATGTVVVRQNGKYLYGGSWDSPIDITSKVTTELTCIDGYGQAGAVNLEIMMTNTTNATNNVPCSVLFKGRVKFSD